MKMTCNKESNKTYITRAQVAEMFSVSSKTVDRWEKKGYFSPYRINSRTIRYLQDEVINFMENNKVLQAC